MCIEYFILANVFIRLWLLHIFSTRELSVVAHSNNFAQYKSLRSVSHACAKESDVFLSKIQLITVLWR